MNRLPSLFISHGAPTFALAPGLAGAQLGALGKAFGAALPRPKAVLVVSPHWITREPEISGASRPETIYDFGGFDPALFKLKYPADGHPVLAARAAELLRSQGWAATVNPGQGLDHGAWVPLMHLFPAHDVPVFQASIPYRLDAQSAFDYGRALRLLGEEGLLVLGSGSLTHNLHEFRMDPQRFAPQAAQSGEPAHYAEVFSAWVREAVRAGDEARLLSTLQSAPHAARAHPTTEHFLPLLLALGAAPSALPVTVMQGGITHGMLSMESYVFGAELAIKPRAVSSSEATSATSHV
jgi:4,5-DOPA dioxygenase extradiol